jgi:hypothetical protein
MLSFTRWCTSTMSLLALIGAAFVATPRPAAAHVGRTDSGSAVRADVALDAVPLSAQRGSHLRHPRTATRCETPLRSVAFDADHDVAIVQLDQTNTLHVPPRSRVAESYDATGPPGTLLT